VQADAVEAALDAGDSFPVDTVGDPAVPSGMVGVTFEGRAGHTYRLIRWDDDYSNRGGAVGGGRVGTVGGASTQFAVPESLG
jgi:hypothetical protein